MNGDIFETVLLNLGEHAAVTSYAVVIAAGALLACLLTILFSRRVKLNINAALGTCIAGLLGALVVGRLAYVAANYIITEAYMDPDMYPYGAAFPLMGWLGGYNLYGALFGGMAAIALYARICRHSVSACLNMAAPGAVLVIVAERFAQVFTDQGLGKYLQVADEEAGLPFPIGVRGPWDTWQLPVFFYDGVLMLILLAVAVILLVRSNGEQAALPVAALISLVLIVTESMREDDIIRFGFVRFNQLCAALTVAAVMGHSVVRQVRTQGGWSGWQTVRIVLLFLGAGIVIGMEFALDKSDIDNVILYIVMTAAVVMMGFVTFKAAWANRKQDKVSA